MKSEILRSCTGRRHMVRPRGSRRQYPWGEMEPGDWFSTPGGPEVQRAIAASAAQVARQCKGHRYRTTTHQGQVYCVRVPVPIVRRSLWDLVAEKEARYGKPA